MPNKNRVMRLVFAALFLAAAFVLPFLTANWQTLGQQLLPMHFPVMLCGFLCGAPWGAVVGFAAPVLRSVCLGMPVMFPSAIGMAFELAAYGALCGLLSRLLPRKPGSCYIALIGAMIGGRAVWGLVSIVLYGIAGTPFSFAVFFTRAFASCVPGMIAQIVLLPPLMMLLQKYTDLK